MRAEKYYQTQHQPGPSRPLIALNRNLNPPQWFVRLGRRTFNVTDQMQRVLKAIKDGRL